MSADNETGGMDHTRNADGSVTASFDIDGDGKPETVTARRVEMADGTDAIELDLNSDGVVDAIAVDENNDGRIDIDEVRPAE
ncbi:MAG TPA: hypothetical protein VGL93_11445 [Streptosporangiaceae bacterium]|jgi:hypothetical protein